MLNFIHQNKNTFFSTPERLVFFMFISPNRQPAQPAGPPPETTTTPTSPEAPVSAPEAPAVVSEATAIEGDNVTETANNALNRLNQLPAILNETFQRTGLPDGNPVRTRLEAQMNEVFSRLSQNADSIRTFLTAHPGITLNIPETAEARTAFIPSMATHMANPEAFTGHLFNISELTQDEKNEFTRIFSTILNDLTSNLQNFNTTVRREQERLISETNADFRTLIDGVRANNDLSRYLDNPSLSRNDLSPEEKQKLENISIAIRDFERNGVRQTSTAAETVSATPASSNEQQEKNHGFAALIAMIIAFFKQIKKEIASAEGTLNEDGEETNDENREQRTANREPYEEQITSDNKLLLSLATPASINAPIDGKLKLIKDRNEPNSYIFELKGKGSNENMVFYFIVPKTSTLNEEYRSLVRNNNSKDIIRGKAFINLTSTVLLSMKQNDIESPLDQTRTYINTILQIRQQATTPQTPSAPDGTPAGQANSEGRTTEIPPANSDRAAIDLNNSSRPRTNGAEPEPEPEPAGSEPESGEPAPPRPRGAEQDKLRERIGGIQGMIRTADTKISALLRSDATNLETAKTKLANARTAVEGALNANKTFPSQIASIMALEFERFNNSISALSGRNAVSGTMSAVTRLEGNINAWIEFNDLRKELIEKTDVATDRANVSTDIASYRNEIRQIENSNSGYTGEQNIIARTAILKELLHPSTPQPSTSSPTLLNEDGTRRAPVNPPILRTYE